MILCASCGMVGTTTLWYGGMVPYHTIPHTTALRNVKTDALLSSCDTLRGRSATEYTFPSGQEYGRYHTHFPGGELEKIMTATKSFT
jgi:hypothetical protein